MKLASFEVGGRPTWGIVDGDEVIDLGLLFPDLRSALAGDALGRLDVAGAPRHERAAIRWLPVIPNPDKIFCIGLNYEDHRKETGREAVEHPTVFARYANSQTGHLRDVPLTPLSTKLDYEGELAVIIGRGGRYIDRRTAPAHVAGYACYNDISVRDWQNHSHQFTPGKNFPDTGAFGPWMMTPDELGDLAALRLRTRVNGVTVQQATFDQMIFDVPRLIEYCSSFTRLEPGDIIVSGTPGGVGAKRTPPLWLRPGDFVEVEIDGLAVLRNRITAETVT